MPPGSLATMRIASRHCANPLSDGGGATLNRTRASSPENKFILDGLFKILKIAYFTGVCFLGCLTEIRISSVLDKGIAKTQRHFVPKIIGYKLDADNLTRGHNSRSLKITVNIKIKNVNQSNAC